MDSNGKPFTVLSTPTITTLSPTSGAVGASITITGTNFGATQGTSTLTFNGVAATPTGWSATSIHAPVPSGATTGNVVVTVGGVASAGKAFTVAPAITTLSPSTGATGTVVTIDGTSFGSPQGTSTVKFNGTTVTPTSWSTTSIVVPVPSGATTGPVVVTVSGVASAGVTFTVLSTPSITSLSPASGIVGTSVTITGTNFGSTQGASTVQFNGTPATPTGWSVSSITVQVPTGATAGNVVITVGGVASNGVSFTVVAPPTIDSLSPTSGVVSDLVTIAGANFNATQGTNTVKFNGTLAAPTNWSGTSIVVPVPSAATSGNVVVTVSGVLSNGLPFTVSGQSGNTPLITAISPTTAVVGSLVRIVGRNLTVSNQQTVVTVGSLLITDVHSTSDSDSLYFVVPEEAASGNLTVTVGAQSSNSLPFTVATPPQIHALFPFDVAPNAMLTISGLYFGANGGGGNALLIDGQATTPSSWTDSQITVQAPSVAGTHSIAVLAAGSQSASLQFKTLSFGGVSGNVTSNGSAVAGALVQGVAGQSATTDGSGNFSFSSVPTGTYSVGVNASGYVPSSGNQAAVTTGAITNVQIQLASPSPTAIFIVPNGITVTVGGGQTLTLVDQQGMPVVGATWSTDDSTVALFNTQDNSLTGAAIGSTNARATWGSYQASIPVSVIAPTNTLWSSHVSGQQGPGLPLAKTGIGPDFVYADSSNLYGVSYDDGVVWQQLLSALPTLEFSRAAADENGDFVVPGWDPVTGVDTITKFSGASGLPQWTHFFDAGVTFRVGSYGSNGSFAVDAEGDVYVTIINQNATAHYSTLVELDSSNGQAALTFSLPDTEASSTGSSCGDAFDLSFPPILSQISVLSDDSVQMQYETSLSRSFLKGPFACAFYETVATDALHLVTISGNSVSTSQLGSGRYIDSGVPDPGPGGNLPDGNGGTINIWFDLIEAPNSNQFTSAITHFKDSTTGMTFDANNISSEYLVYCPRTM